MDDPYQKMLGAMTRNAERQVKKGALRLRLGTVLALEPLELDVAGTRQKQEQQCFYCNVALLKDYSRKGDVIDPSGTLAASGSDSDGDAITSISPSSGTLSCQGLKWTDHGFVVGDLLLLLTDDDQTFYIVAKMRKLE